MSNLVLELWQVSPGGGPLNHIVRVIYNQRPVDLAGALERSGKYCRA